jgi:nucleotide-binding universal stress UspA family protein
VLVPITAAVPQQPLIDQLTRLLYSLDVGPVQFTMVHVGGDKTIPSPSLPPRSDWMWRTDVRRGSVVEQILEAEVEHEVDLIAIATHGHDSIMDAILGSTMERVVRRAGCPVYAVPV